MATEHPRAAVGKTANHWIPQPELSFQSKPMDCRLVRRLHELGWSEGSTVAIEYRWVEGHAERLSAFADELVRLKVSVIVTSSTPPTIAAKQATSVVPIVFVASGDPVGSGVVTSLARPGGNVTGLSNQSVEAVSKRVELLRDVVPNLRRLAVMTTDSNPVAMREAEK